MIFYTLLYFVVCNWMQIVYLLINILKPKQKILTLNNRELISKYKKKTGLILSIKIIYEERRIIGFMISSPPFKPTMIFSSKLYQAFNKDELDWVILHEAGHYLMWHNYCLILTQLLVFIIGLLIIISFEFQLLILIIVSLTLPIIYIQLTKIFEYQADYYAVTHMDNPKGMITGNIKMKKYNTKGLGFETSLFKKFFIGGVPYEERIKMAEKELKLRKIRLFK